MEPENVIKFAVGPVLLARSLDWAFVADSDGRERQFGLVRGGVKPMRDVCLVMMGLRRRLGRSSSLSVSERRHVSRLPVAEGPVVFLVVIISVDADVVAEGVFLILLVVVLLGRVEERVLGGLDFVFDTLGVAVVEVGLGSADLGGRREVGQGEKVRDEESARTSLGTFSASITSHPPCQPCSG